MKNNQWEKWRVIIESSKMRLVRRLFIVIPYLNIFACSHQNYKENVVLENTWASITSPGRLQDIHNLTVYLGYANNPFGPSTRLQQKNKMFDLSGASFSKDQMANMPVYNQIIPEDKANSVDSGRHEITSQEQRSKRGVTHLYNMVKCATGCNPLIYKGYGCYCGFLGSGYAVDGIDRCCKLHDWCYDTAKCPMFLEYFVPYLWKCYRNKPLCAIHHGRWGGPGSCAQRLCECDRLLSECLSRYPCPSTRAICTSSPWRLLQNALMIL